MQINLRDLLIGTGLVFGAFVLAVLASALLNRLSVPLAPLLVNVGFYFAMITVLGTAFFAGRLGVAIAPVIFFAAWAAASELHAQLLSHSVASKGLELPRLAPTDNLSIEAPLGLYVDKSRSGGRSVLMPWQCLEWCEDILLRLMLASITLPNMPPASARSFRTYRIGEICSDNRETACIISAETAAQPMGVLVRMDEDRNRPNAGSLCCVTLEVDRVTGEGAKLVTSFRQESAMTIFALPIVLAGLDHCRSPWFMRRDVFVGDVITFDRAIETMLNASVAWR